MHLVLLPGMDGTGLLFEPLLLNLPAGVSAEVVAYPGNRPLRYSELLPIVQASMPSNRPFVLLGESFSGPLALMAAAAKPQGLQGVILCSSFIRNPITYIPQCASFVSFGFVFHLAPHFLLLKALLSGYSSVMLRALMAKAHSAVLPRVMARRAKDILRVNVEEELMKVECPILYLRGAGDKVVSERSLRQIQRLKPETQVATVPGPHLVLQVSPKESINAIMLFAKSNGAF